ncbi:MAG: helix-turn-helix domain-containing protein [Fimbriimonadaceae bacterium]
MRARVRSELLFRSHFTTSLGEIKVVGTLRDSLGVPGPMRVLGDFALVLILHGSGTFGDARGARERVTEGDFLVLFPEVGHRYGPGQRQEWDELYIVFNGPIFEVLRGAALLDPSRPVVRGVGADWFDRMHAFARKPLIGDELDITDFVRLLVEPLMRHEHRERSWIERAQSMLGQDLSARLAADRVAARLHISPQTFRKRFAATTGMTPTQYRAGRRIEAAKTLLRQTEMTHRQIAISLGFYDEYYFANRFKAATGQTAGEFRRGGRSEVAG